MGKTIKSGFDAANGEQDNPSENTGNENTEVANSPNPPTNEGAKEVGAPLQPNTSTVAKPADTKPALNHANKTPVILGRGQVLVAVLDKNGQELAGSDFVTSESTANKYYGDTTKFIIKKKHN